MHRFTPTFYLDGQPYIYEDGALDDPECSSLIEKALTDTSFGYLRTVLNMRGLVELPEEGHRLTYEEGIQRLSELCLGMMKLLSHPVEPAVVCPMYRALTRRH